MLYFFDFKRLKLEKIPPEIKSICSFPEEEIKRLNILDKKEIKQGKNMLTSAALTYVASVATTLLEILRLILMFTGRNND